MAAPGSTPIQLYHTTTASATPSAGNLVTGELGLNVTDKKIYSKDGGGSVVQVGSGPDATETLTNKTISADSNTLSGIAASSFVLSNASGNIDGAAAQKAIPSGAVVGTTDAQTLTNKTLTSPDINGGTWNGTIDGNWTAVSQTCANLGSVTTADINGGTIDGATIGGSTAAAGTFTTLNTTGNVTLGDASTDIVTVNGYMGVGIAPSSAIALNVQPSALSGGSQYGVVSTPVGTSAATSLIAAYNGQPATAAAAFTVSTMAHYRAGTVTKGAGSTITDLHGVLVNDQTQGTNNYGITSLVSSGTNKWNIYASGTAANYFAGNVGIANSSLFSWSSAYRHISNYFSTALFASNAGDAGVVSGAYFDGTNWLYTGNYVPSLYQFGPSLGRHSFSTAPANASGAGATATFTERFRITNTEAVFNDPGNDYAFRIESDTSTHAFFLDGATGNVSFNNTTVTGIYGTTVRVGPNGGAGTIYLPGGYIYTAHATNQLNIVGGQGSNGPITFQSNSGTERIRIDSVGNIIQTQPAPAAVNTTATLTTANLRTRIITSTTAALVTGTLPTGTLMDSELYSSAADMGYDWSVINTGGTNNFVVAAGTGHTVVGNMTVSPNTTGMFRSHRTATNTWITYRVG